MNEKTYQGITNASGGIALDDRHFIVADDERNQLCIFNIHGESPLKPSIKLWKVFAGEIEDGKHQEIDLEGAARIGDVLFWIGSHSTSSKGNDRPARRRLFGIRVTEIEEGEFSAQRCGQIYTQLVADLNRDKRFDSYRLDLAQTIAPKNNQGLSIEGLAPTPEQGLLIGFRNPLAGNPESDGSIVGGKALLVPLLNPLAVLQGSEARFGEPIELALDGLGIRDITWRQGHEYLIVAGPHHANKDRSEKHRLYLWDSGSGALTQLDHIDLGLLNIEAAFFFPNRTDRLELLTDDGEKPGFRCISVAI